MEADLPALLPMIRGDCAVVDVKRSLKLSIMSSTSYEPSIW